MFSHNVKAIYQNDIENNIVIGYTIEKVRRRREATTLIIDVVPPLYVAAADETVMLQQFVPL